MNILKPLIGAALLAAPLSALAVTSMPASRYLARAGAGSVEPLRMAASGIAPLIRPGDRRGARAGRPGRASPGCRTPTGR
jgi:hypothetical protein